MNDVTLYLIHTHTQTQTPTQTSLFKDELIVFPFFFVLF